MLYRKNYHLNNLKCYANEFNINCNKPRLIKYRQLYNFCQDHNKNKKLINLKKYKEIKKSVKNKYGVDNISQIQSVKEKKKKTILVVDDASMIRNLATKTAQEAHAINQRLTALYEDIGGVLNRYYEISEDGDMDNDGVDEPDDEEYLQ